MKFLIIRLSSIGDIVLTTPVIRCLKKSVPEAEIHFLTKTSYTSILNENPYISKLHEWGKNEKESLDLLKKENFDYIIDLHHNLRTLRIKRFLKPAKHFSFPKLNIQKWLYTALKINVLPGIHIVDRYMETVKSFGVRNDGQGLDYFIPQKDEVQASDLPATHASGYLSIVIGAALNTKKLPVEKIKKLTQEIQYPIILLGGPEDRITGEEIAAEDRIKIYNACGKFNLNESAWLIKQSLLVISHDTGLMHIAAAFHKKIIAIWGNTVPAFGMSPYYGNTENKSQNFEVRHLFCRPCSKIGYNKCPLGHFKCMQHQNIEQIGQAAKEWL
ncbi:MAG: glycosyltransferase family 9 protein [Bacteroidetes bacterium]|nr:glycosyltransferase family 9 protein [Bacteroidota bacterium]